MSTADELFRELPELPRETFEAVGTLERSERGPFVTLRPHKPPPPQEPTVPASAVSKSSYSIRRYYTQATYPRLICYDPGVLVESMATRVDPPPPGRDRAPTDISARAREERFYKLSALENVSPGTLWCSVKYGPWLAEVTETESCLEGVPNQWEFFIIEMPEVALVWFGEWEDMPAFPSLSVTMNDRRLFKVEGPFCCAGYKWCPTTGSCIPDQVPCQDATPA
jgi:hypothetical protein